MSFNSFNELIVIGDSQSSDEAARESGNIRYRWGNPANYNRSGPVKTAGQHCSRWIKEFESGYRYPEKEKIGVGDILWFNNLHDRVDQIRPPIIGDPNTGEYYSEKGIFGPTETHWTFDFKDRFDDGRQSSAQRLPNGNTLIAFSNEGTFIEITRTGDLMWKYVSPLCTLGEGSEPKTIPDFVRQWNDKSCEALGFLKNGYYFNLNRYAVNFKGFEGKPFLENVKPLVPLPQE